MLVQIWSDSVAYCYYMNIKSQKIGDIFYHLFNITPKSYCYITTDFMYIFTVMNTGWAVSYTTVSV